MFNFNKTNDMLNNCQEKMIHDINNRLEASEIDRKRLERESV